MNKNEFLEELLELMEREEKITEDMRLDDIDEWDSLARITFMSFLNAEFGINVASEDLKSSRTVADLLKFVETNIGDL